ncbi:MAG: hypothetical protein E5Y06_00125 [Mesorhizobium sp.]|nr:MAG: hypothetical protein E5Y06_00125 [Mesorhizobium sp.]
MRRDVGGTAPPLACRPSPPQGGRLAVSQVAPPLQHWRLAKASTHPISPLAGEMSGRTEGGVKERGVRWTAALLPKPPLSTHP